MEDLRSTSAKTNAEAFPKMLETDRVSRVPLQEMILGELRRRIEEGRIRPGQILLESHVSKAFNVSRSPARVALGDLLRSGLVKPGPEKGFIVFGDSARDDEGKLAQLDKVELRAEPRWEAIYAEIEEQICTRLLFESLRLNEGRLAAHFGVSRTVAHDVVARLDSQGIIRKNENGYWIAEQISVDRATDIYELRAILEPYALGLSAPHLPLEVLQNVRQAHRDALRLTNIKRINSLTNLEQGMHKEILSYCPNRELLGAIEKTHLLLPQVRYMFNYYNYFSDTESDGVIEQHMAVLDLLFAREPSKAAKALRNHLKAAAEVWRNRLAEIEGVRLPSLPTYLTSA